MASSPICISLAKRLSCSFCNLLSFSIIPLSFFNWSAGYFSAGFKRSAKPNFSFASTIFLSFTSWSPFEIKLAYSFAVEGFGGSDFGISSLLPSCFAPSCFIPFPGPFGAMEMVGPSFTIWLKASSLSFGVKALILFRIDLV